ncbi:MAG: sensor diguanylate cyclase [Sphingomonas bacterium]|uniref:hypothetical protein n=1 Tax=Sphingomonas bacterium TaxID=1895847 RepID=UPI002622909C|nr:hypothetical protein [Sphingomonas bacterium]MDB5710797.1 sensor diguanylate cyclase [Sphingomonas bacterium]
MDWVKARLPEGTYIELVASLFSTLLPTAIMTVSFLGAALLIAVQTPDRLLTVLSFAGMLAAGARLTALLLYRKRARLDALDVADDRQMSGTYRRGSL